ncbi:unnamed protein product [Trichogramma brassicae]|uniref:RNA-directed DNA polymerase n=1 Tax=Trichogramma brassicae TaxID=86971 RepID=A0A6H5ILP2_9HYME|nr:unnamed protein product [Trichogramma brassicae]
MRSHKRSSAARSAERAAEQTSGAASGPTHKDALLGNARPPPPAAAYINRRAATVREIRLRPKRARHREHTSAVFGGTATFGAFQRGLTNEDSNWRSIQQTQRPGSLNGSIGRGQSARQTSRTDRRPGSGANSDMSLDASTSTSPGQTPRYQPPPLRVDNASGDSRTLETLVITMIEENRRRDQQRDAMMERLFMQLSMNTTAPRAGENTAPATTAEAPVQSYQVMPDLTKNIENFTGDESPAEAREWISNIQSMLLLHHWPEEFALETARMHLVRGARDWFSARRRLVDTWPKFQEAFQTTYVRQDTTVCRWKRMTERTQKKDESLQQYFHNKVKLCADLRLNTQETKEQVLVGLWSKDLFNAMSARSHADVDALLHDMLDYEYRVGQRQERIRSVNAAANPRGQQSGVETKSNGDKSSRNTNERPQRQPSRNEKGEPRCFNCQAYGHFSKDCTQPRKEPYCVGCRTAGHYKKDCQNAVNEISNGREEPSRSTVIKYYKTALVNNKSMSSFIDPGSAACIMGINAAVINQIPIKYEASELKSFGPQDFRVVAPGYVTVSIQVDEAKVDKIKCHVVPDKFLSTEMLIGRTFTDHDSIKYVKEGDSLTFTQMPSLEPSTEKKIKAKETTVTSPSSIYMIDVCADDESVVLPVMNLTKKPVKIQKGSTVMKGNLVELPVLEIKEERQVITTEEIDVGQDQPAEVIQDLVRIINKYRDCVALNMSELGCARGIEVEINEQPDATPVNCKPYRASVLEREKMREILQEWREAGVIRDTTSPYASPVMLVRKKNGDSRLVVDFRKLNNQTQRMHFPLPDTDEHLAEIGDNKLFITLDLFNGYLQLPIAEKSKHKTAIITPDETAEFNRLIFGLTNGPAYFSKYMERILHPLRRQLVLFFLDDIFIAGKSWDDLKPKLVSVFEALRGAGLTINLKKCQFLKDLVIYLGFEISAKGIKPGQNKVDAIAKFPVPRNVHEIRRFLGLTGFFRRFVPRYAEVASPLNDLLKTNRAFIWDEKVRKAFELLRDKLVERPILQPFSPSKYTELHTDAIARGLAGMLLQGDSSKDLRLVYAISRSTSEAERFYHSSKLELLAIVWAVSRLRTLLINITFRIVTDCQALVYMNAHRTKNAQIVRWHHLLSEFNYEIVHREGAKLAHVDALSRAPVENQASANRDGKREEAIASVNIVNDVSVRNDDTGGELNVFTIFRESDEIIAFQYKDEEIAARRDILAKPRNERSRIEKEMVKDLVVTDGILYKNHNEKLCYVVPRSMRKSLVVRFHDYNGHQGVERTLELMSRKYYFRGMRRYVKQHVYSCFQCLAAKTRPGRQRGELHPIPPGKRPFEIVNVDHVGPFVRSSSGNRVVFVLIDNLTKFVILTAMKGTRASTVIKAMENFVCDFGAPKRIISDRGPCFMSANFREFCDKHGIKFSPTSPRHPQANGQCERVNATLIPLMQATIEKPDATDWDVKLKQIQRDLNQSYNASTGKSPFELLYGYVPSHDEGALRDLVEKEEQYDVNHANRHAETSTKILEAQAKMKRRYDLNRSVTYKFNVGDLVFFKVNPTYTGDSTKLQYKNRGPLVITEVLPSDSYRIAEVNTKKANRYCSTAHVTQLKLWTPPVDKYDDGEESSSDEEEGGVALRRSSRLQAQKKIN